jgi:Phosphotransferase enzyme family
MTASAAAHEEILLPGGTTNAGLVSRVGDTVRRPQRTTSPATRALLEHLERVGFESAPRYLGVDERGREVLSYIPGEAAIFPYQSWALTDQALVSVAELLRDYHRAVASFDPADYEWPDPIPAAFHRGLVSHNDPNLDNVIFANGRAIALIDFDLAGPGSAAWDLACAARLWAPLRDRRDAPAETRRRALARLAMFADAYGATAGERAGMVEAFVPCHDWCYAVVRRAVASGHETFGLYWRDGGELRAERTRRWLATHGLDIAAALGLR